MLAERISKSINKLGSVLRCWKPQSTCSDHQIDGSHHSEEPAPIIGTAVSLHKPDVKEDPASPLPRSPRIFAVPDTSGLLSPTPSPSSTPDHDPDIPCCPPQGSGDIPNDPAPASPAVEQLPAAAMPEPTALQTAITSAVRCGVYSDKGSHTTMVDHHAHTVYSADHPLARALCTNGSLVVLAVASGSQGTLAAQTAVSGLCAELERAVADFKGAGLAVSQEAVLRDAIAGLEDILTGRRPGCNPIDSGCSLLVALVAPEDRTVCIAHVGECRAVLAAQRADGSVYAHALTADHHPGRSHSEAKRVHGYCSSDTHAVYHRVPGSQATIAIPASRGLGFAKLKSTTGRSSRADTLSATPTVTMHQLTEEARFLVLCTPGAWQGRSQEQSFATAAVKAAWNGMTGWHGGERRAAQTVAEMTRRGVSREERACALSLVVGLGEVKGKVREVEGMTACHVRPGKEVMRATAKEVAIVRELADLIEEAWSMVGVVNRRKVMRKKTDSHFWS